MSSITQNPDSVQTSSPFDDPEYLAWLDAIDAGHYPDEAPDFEPSPEDWDWLHDDEDFGDLPETFRTIEEWDNDLPTLTQDDKDRIEDWVMSHTEDLDARREWHPEGGAR